jgi:hypothetical protein
MSSHHTMIGINCTSLEVDVTAYVHTRFHSVLKLGSQGYHVFASEFSYDQVGISSNYGTKYKRQLDRIKRFYYSTNIVINMKIC